MKMVTAKDLKNRTGEVISAIKRGEEVVVSYRGKPLGKFIPLKEAPILKEVSGVIEKAPADMKQVKEERLKKKYEGIY